MEITKFYVKKNISWKNHISLDEFCSANTINPKILTLELKMLAPLIQLSYTLK